MEGIYIMIFIWQLMGMFILGVTASFGEWFSLWRLNPVEVYRHFKVNWFGVIWVTVGFNLICPIVSLCYWFYKLCTVGRK